MTVRLNKLLSTRGVGARRKCDALIESGAVRVNGEVVLAPGARIMPDRDRVTVNGRPLPRRIEHRYLMLHKPVGTITTLDDPEGRPTIRDLLPHETRLYPVGRLDADTSGLLLVTNDGDLAHHLMHPRYGLTKHYRVLVTSPPSDQQLERLERGVEFEPGVVSAPARARRRDPTPRGHVIEVSIQEGRYRQVRRMCEAVGLGVIGLHRWAYGPLRLGELSRGLWRDLSEAEVRSLRAASSRPKPRPRLLKPGEVRMDRARVRRREGKTRHEGGARRQAGPDFRAERAPGRASPGRGSRDLPVRRGRPRPERAKGRSSPARGSRDLRVQSGRPRPERAPSGSAATRGRFGSRREAGAPAGAPRRLTSRPPGRPSPGSGPRKERGDFRGAGPPRRGKDRFIPAAAKGQSAPRRGRGGSISRAEGTRPARSGRPGPPRGNRRRGSGGR